MTVSATFLQDPDFIRLLYVVAFALFIVGMRRVTHPTTARRGNHIAAVGMAIAVVATLLIEEVGDYGLIALGIALGTIVGVPAARQVKMTAMPQMVALFNGVGGGAVALISFVEYRDFLDMGGNPPAEELIPILFAAIVGSVSFWGSNIAFAKLQEILPGKPIVFPGQKLINAALLIGAIACAVLIATAAPTATSSRARFTYCCPGTPIGLPGRIPWSLPKAMFEPQKETCLLYTSPSPRDRS